MSATSAQLQAAVEVRRSDSIDRGRTSPAASGSRLGAISSEDLKHAQGAVNTAKPRCSPRRKSSRRNRAHRSPRPSTTIPMCAAPPPASAEAYLGYARTELPPRSRASSPSAGVRAWAARRAGHAADGDRPSRPGLGRRGLQSRSSPTCASARVSLTADLYGSKVDITARSWALARAPVPRSHCCPRRTRPATGSDRPARAGAHRLDPEDLAAHPLQIGLSMQVDVDTHDRSGVRLPQVGAGRRSLCDRGLPRAGGGGRRTRAGDRRRQRIGFVDNSVLRQA